MRIAGQSSLKKIFSQTFVNYFDLEASHFMLFVDTGKLSIIKSINLIAENIIIYQHKKS